MNIKPLLALSLAAFVLPAPTADAGKFDDQMKALEATIAEADAKAEKACALAKIKVRQKAAEDLSVAKKEALRKENLEQAVALKAKIDAVSGEVEGLLAIAGKKPEKPAEKTKTDPGQAADDKRPPAALAFLNGKWILKSGASEIPLSFDDKGHLFSSRANGWGNGKVVKMEGRRFFLSFAGRALLVQDKGTLVVEHNGKATGELVTRVRE